MKFLVDAQVEYNPGIYRITNIHSKKVYIGSTTSLRVRFNYHKAAPGKGEHSSPHFQNSFDKWGTDAFIFEAIHIFDKSIWGSSEQEIKKILELEEQKWIDAYDAANKEKGYNMCSVAGSTLGLRHIEETKEFISECSRKSWETTREKRMSTLHSMKKWVLVYNYPDGHFVGKFKGIVLASEYLSQETGISVGKWSMIYTICNQSISNKKYSQGYLSSHGYTFRWWDEKSEESVWIDLAESEGVKLKRKSDARNAQKFSVLKKKKWFLVYDRYTGNFIKEIFGLEEACVECNITDNSRIINNAKGINGYAGDYIFRYKTDNDYPLQITPRITRYSSQQAKQNVIDASRKRGNPILVYNAGNFVGGFLSKHDIHRKLDIPYWTVVARIKSGQDHEGYTFKYKDPNYVPKKKPRKRKLATPN